MPMNEPTQRIERPRRTKALGPPPSAYVAVILFLLYVAALLIYFGKHVPGCHTTA